MSRQSLYDRTDLTAMPNGFADTRQPVDLLTYMVAFADGGPLDLESYPATALADWDT